MKKAIIYARVASGTPASAEAAIRDQIAVCRAHGAVRGYEIVGEYHDWGSGTNPHRVGLGQLFEAVSKLRDDAPIVIVEDQARLARSIEAYLEIDRTLSKIGASVEVAIA